MVGPALLEMIEAYLRGHRLRAMELHLALADLTPEQRSALARCLQEVQPPLWQALPAERAGR